MLRITESEYNSKSRDYRGVWTTERTDWSNWEQVKDTLMGKRTLLTNENGATVLLIEGTGFEIIPDK